jgi:hypothetical protein
LLFGRHIGFRMRWLKVRIIPKREMHKKRSTDVPADRFLSRVLDDDA